MADPQASPQPDPRVSVLDTELQQIAADQSAPLRREIRYAALGAGEGEGAEAETAEKKSEKRQVLKLWVEPRHVDEVTEWIAKTGGKVISTGHRVLVVELPVGRIVELDGVEGVRRAGAPKQLLQQLDFCRGESTGLLAALERHGLTGKGVVVGIVDSGVDWSHPDFVEDDGTTRLELLLHAQRHQDVSRFDRYGRKKLNAALARLRKGAPHRRLAVPGGDPDGHGTHCASIAAGNGRASNGRFRGVAPESTLMASRSDLYDDQLIWSIREIFRRARELKMPAVINLSVGHHRGAHDGTASLENVIAEQAGAGRIVVVAAGNEAELGIHWQGELVPDRSLEIPFRIVDDWQFVDLWVHRGDDVEVSVEAPGGELLPLNQGETATEYGTCVADWRTDAVNQDNNLTLLIEGGTPGQVWKVRLRPSAVLHGTVHAWGGTSHARHPVIFPAGASSSHSIGIPATEERAIAVASWVCRTSYLGPSGAVEAPELALGQLSPFSSRGPTRHGVSKPDIAAPGHFVTAALAAGSQRGSSGWRHLHHPDGPYITLKGTSMAAPFVAGVVALMLERDPGLTPEEVQQRLRITARRDADTGRVWQPGFGWGKLDVAALLDYRG